MKTYSSLPGDEEEPRVVPCPLCGRSQFRPLWDCPLFSFVKCRHCGGIYQNPQAEASHIQSRYDENYFSYEIDNESSFLNLMKLGLEDVKFSEWEPVLKGKGKALDVGCATGALIGWLKQRGWNAEGLEICRPSAQFAREKRGVLVHEVPLERANLEQESYSFIHSSHVIEHLTDPVTMVKEVFRLLVPGGYFVCVTPNTSSLQAALYKDRWRSAIADHLVLFSAGRLKALLRSQGLTVIDGKTWGGIAEGAAPRSLKRVLDKMAKRFGFGDVVLILARKD